MYRWMVNDGFRRHHANRHHRCCDFPHHCDYCLRSRRESCRRHCYGSVPKSCAKALNSCVTAPSNRGLAKKSCAAANKTGWPEECKSATADCSCARADCTNVPKDCRNARCSSLTLKAAPLPLHSPNYVPTADDSLHSCARFAWWCSQDEGNFRNLQALARGPSYCPALPTSGQRYPTAARHCCCWPMAACFAKIRAAAMRFQWNSTPIPDDSVRRSQADSTGGVPSSYPRGQRSDRCH